jgi:uncharacterized protein (TIGR02231 family)
MKKYILTSIALFSILTFFSQINVTSKIDHVTIFMQGAEISHEAMHKVSKGKNQIVLTGLSPDLDPNSVVVNVQPANVSILSVSSRNNYLKPVVDNQKIALVKDSMRLISDEVQHLNDRISTLQREKDILFKNEAIGGTSQGVSIAEIEKAADFYRNRHNQINDQLFELNKKQSAASARLLTLVKQSDELNAQYNPPTSEITIELSSPSDVQCTFAFAYMVSKAGWAPKYDVRTEKMGDPISLVYHANVFNNCGLDWLEVKMKLSTADPLRGANKPTLEAWDVAAIQKLPSVAGGVVQLNTVEITSKSSDYFKGKEEDVKFQNIEVQELTAEFEIPIPYSILADSKPYTVDVTSYTLPAIYEHYAVPSMEKDGYLTAKITGWNNLNLVSGNASIFFKGTYLGQSFINTSSVEDTLAISLGRDKNIGIERKKLVDVSKRQVVGNNEKETSFFETTVRNNSDKAVTITVEDQVPISSKGEIVVDILELSGGELDKATGKVKWRLVLAAGETQKTSLGYSIKRPKGQGSSNRRRYVASPSF